MTESRKSTARSSKQAKSDLARFDASEIQPEEYADAPDLTDRDLSEGQIEIGGRPMRRGRPTKQARKISTTIRLDPDILTHFKAGGRGWHGRINAALRKAMVG